MAVAIVTDIGHTSNHFECESMRIKNVFPCMGPQDQHEYMTKVLLAIARDATVPWVTLVLLVDNLHIAVLTDLCPDPY